MIDRDFILLFMPRIILIYQVKGISMNGTSSASGRSGSALFNQNYLTF